MITKRNIPPTEKINFVVVVMRFNILILNYAIENDCCNFIWNKEHNSRKLHIMGKKKRRILLPLR